MTSIFISLSNNHSWAPAKMSPGNNISNTRYDIFIIIKKLFRKPRSSSGASTCTGSDVGGCITCILTEGSNMISSP
jgi:hypothetical protein